uniref:Uncharacterized protein LOC114343547 n=1 Tax=Diabrotica virgifera virgifera TaxID=50390 RepID=A0A6P7GVX8_DIAVI
MPKSKRVRRERSSTNSSSSTSDSDSVEKHSETRKSKKDYRVKGRLQTLVLAHQILIRLKNSETRKSKKDYRKCNKKNEKRSYTPPIIAPVSTLNYIPNHQHPNRNKESVNFIPDFDPLISHVDQWIEILEHNARIYSWTDSFIVYQAISKLRGTAETWYKSFIENEPNWSKFLWSEWKTIFQETFQSSKNTYDIFMDIANHKPRVGESLYAFHFEHLAKINKLRVNFTNTEKVSLILGAINDPTMFNN